MCKDIVESSSRLCIGTTPVFTSTDREKRKPQLEMPLSDRDLDRVTTHFLFTSFNFSLIKVTGNEPDNRGSILGNAETSLFATTSKPHLELMQAHS